MRNNLPKLIVIAGPTASGKTALSIKIAKKFGGEIISADSRQVYKGMDIGTAKITPDTKNSSNFSTGQAKKNRIFTHKGIPHYCIDVASPKRKFSVTRYKKLAIEAIEKILKNGKIPILCGGTGFYIQAVIDDAVIPEVPPDWQLRKNLEKKSPESLFKILKKLDPHRAAAIDKKNTRRLIRAIEIVIKTGKPVPRLKTKKNFDVLMLGIKKPHEEIKRRIKKRLIQRFRQGMVAEVKQLRAEGVSWKRLEEFGLEYRWIARYLQGKLSFEEMFEKLQKDSERYAKRQMTWFKKDPVPSRYGGSYGASKRMQWIKNYREAERLIMDFVFDN